MGDQPQLLKVDKTKLKTFKSYATMNGTTVQTVYRWAESGKIKLEEIDGVKFVKIP